jgi:hypothetical protein
MATDTGPGGDAGRQAEIDALPEEVEIVFDDGEKKVFSMRAQAQEQDDMWRKFRDSPIGKTMLGTDLAE